MLIMYDSLTGNVKRFANKLKERGFECVNIKDIKTVNKSFVLITYTINFGKVPESTINFLESENNKMFIKGISSSGNKNWGSSFGNAADIISHIYNVPIISKFELQGTQKDVDYFIKRIGDIVEIY